MKPGRWLTAVILLLSGCGSAPPVPEDHYYRLEAGPGVADSGRSGPPVRVLLPEADSLYHGRAILYVRPGRPLELHRYRYRLWAAPPPRMLLRLTREYLGARVAEPGESALELTLRLRHFEVEQGDPSAARFGVTAVLRDPASGCVLFRRRYDYRQPAQAPTHYALVQAFQTAVDRYLSRLAEDLAHARSRCAAQASPEAGSGG